MMIGAYSLRREAVLAVERTLAEAAKHRAFVPSYARNNPRLGLRHNVFYFGELMRPPRAVIIGSYLYVQAPGVPLPAGVEPFSERERARTHLGTLHGRLLLTEPRAPEILSRLVRALKKTGA
jgi:hypothetical protein